MVKRVVKEVVWVSNQKGAEGLEFLDKTECQMFDFLVKLSPPSLVTVANDELCHLSYAILQHRNELAAILNEEKIS